MSTVVFEDYSAYYDLLYADKDYDSETNAVSGILRAADAGMRSILEFGSGTGKHGRRLAALGFDVVGIERSESMLSVAQQEPGAPASAGRFTCRQGDIRDARIDQVFDAVVSLFHVVSYQTSNEDLRATFANAGRHLQAGGLFFFDVWHGPAVLTERPAARLKHTADDRHQLWRAAEPTVDINAGLVHVKYTLIVCRKDDARVTVVEERHSMRYLFPTEVALLADAAGFDVVRAQSFPDGGEPSPSTWGVGYLLRKRA